MNSLAILVFSVLWVLLAYRFFGRNRIQNRLFAPLDTAPTPAHSKNDGVDFSPAPRLVLFGHHFSSIAGAGPIVGPIIAVSAFGWGPTVLWLLIGGVLIGGVHDYLSLMISVRHGGTSIPDNADRYISRRARFLFLIFVLLALILVVAVFAAFAAGIMVTQPEIVIPTFLLIPLAMVFGLLQKRRYLNLPINTLLALLCLMTLIWLGMKFPISLPLNENFSLLGIHMAAADWAFVIWFSLLMAYAFFASVAPVWLLLQPRDYISSWVLILGVSLAFVGILVTRPVMNAPFFTGAIHPEQGPVFPFLFIIVACGAVSGFHSIVASGTTSKQLNRETDALPVAYGAMIAETIIGIIAVIIAGGAIAWSGEGGLGTLLGSSTPLSVFGLGFGRITGFMFGSHLGALIGITIINIFIMTSLDTSVRLARFLSGEILVHRFPRMSRNRMGITLIAIIPAFLLGVSGEWKSVWPVFGSANQLVAALVLIVITAYLLSRGKPIHYTWWATIFMLITTVTALILLAWKYLFSAKPRLVMGVLSLVLIMLAILMVGEGIKLLRRSR